LEAGRERRCRNREYGECPPPEDYGSTGDPPSASQVVIVVLALNEGFFGIFAGIFVIA
jgi:hypothetical protein